MFPLHDPLTDAAREALGTYDDLTASLLARRGVLTEEDAERFLNPSYDNHLHDPFLMVDMQKAAERLGAAILSGERIAVWSDYDCDGIPGGVLLHDFLKKAGANFENYIPHRHDDGYGMSVSGVEKLVREGGATLIVTVDCGIVDIEPVARAGELGADVIVTDHHLPAMSEVDGPILPAAFAILDPHARADETYPFHELCGAAVAWKLVCATLSRLHSAQVARDEKPIPEGWEKWLLDMVGLATIADMVPLIGENRVLAAYGLRVIRKSPRIGLQKLCRMLRVEQRALTEDDIGFMLAPRVNAASRMGDARDAFSLFTTTDESGADMLAKKLEAANRQRKAAAGAITRAVRARLSARGGSASGGKESGIRSVIALGDPEWRPALLGLVANTIAEEYERPVFLWGREGLPAGRQGTGKLKGSVRSGGATHVMELMSATENTFVQCGGHARAGGFTLRDTEVFFLEDRLVLALRSLSEGGEAQSDTFAQYADAAITPEEATLAFLQKMERLAPFGQQNPKPAFLLRDVSVREISHFGKGEEHLKLKIDIADGRGSIDAVTFFAKGSIVRVVETVAAGGRAHLLAHLERDMFSRGNPVRLRLLDIRLI